VLAGVELSRGRLPEAEELYRRSLVTAEHALGPSHPDLVGPCASCMQLTHTPGYTPGVIRRS
jgi:hypothetical protein